MNRQTKSAIKTVAGITAPALLLGALVLIGVQMSLNGVHPNLTRGTLWMLAAGSFLSVMAAMFEIWSRVMLVSAAFGFTMLFTLMWLLVRGA